jgi:predicted RNase H-like HicB family nuclease
MRYKVVLIHSDEGVAIECPALPGCVSQGATEDEALENIADAIREWLAAVDDLIREREKEDCDNVRKEVREVEVAV